jgi:hypothetical protein
MAGRHFEEVCSSLKLRITAFTEGDRCFIAINVDKAERSGVIRASSGSAAAR